MVNSRFVQYGCGFCAPTTWRNFDASPTLRLQRLPVIGRIFHISQFPDWPENVEYGDMIKGLPLKANSCRAIYCAHVLEHFALDDLRMVLQNTYRYLEPGGIFRFVMPDLERHIRDYVSNGAPEAAHIFMTNTHLGTKTRAKGLNQRLRESFGTVRHLWMWDYRAMSAELQQVGFRDIRRAKFGDSDEPQFQDVEEPYRWNNGLGIECLK